MKIINLNRYPLIILETSHTVEFQGVLTIYLKYKKQEFSIISEKANEITIRLNVAEKEEKKSLGDSLIDALNKLFGI